MILRFLENNEERKVRIYISHQRVVIVDDCMKETVVEKNKRKKLNFKAMETLQPTTCTY